MDLNESGQTHTTENITFPQIRWRDVKFVGENKSMTDVFRESGRMTVCNCGMILLLLR